MIKELFRWRGRREKKILKPDLYLHIGMGKTGTTALQEFFWENRRALKQYGICYPDYCAVSAAHHRLSPHIPEFLKEAWRFEPVSDWAPKIARIQSEKILLSSELMAWAKPEVIESFCVELKRWFNVYVVLYLRRQDNLIMAGYNQQIKAGTQKKDIYSVLDLQIDRFDYDKKMLPWVSSLGKEKIIVRPYERQQFCRGDIRFDFLHYVFGIDIFEDFKLIDDNSNPRLSFAAMEYKRWINGLFQDTSISSCFNDVLLKYSAETDGSSTSIFSSSSVLSPSDRLAILKRFEKTNIRIAEEYLGRKDGILFYEKLPAVQDNWTMPSLPEKSYEEITDYIKINDPKVFGLFPKEVVFANNKKIIVHFGTHKTGSSSIQNAFYELNSERIDYLCYKQPNSSQIIGNAFFKPENLYRKRKDGIKRYSEIRSLARSRLDKIIEAAGGKESVLSAEVISYLDYDELNELVNYLKRWYEEVRFVGYVREPVGFTVSAFQEVLKRRYLSLDSFKPIYDRFVENIESIIGVNNVDVYLYDRLAFPGGSVVNHLFGLLDFDCSILDGRKDNASLSLSATKILFSYRFLEGESEGDVGHPKSLSLFLNALSKVGGEKFSVTNKLADKIKTRNERVVGWLKSRFGDSYVRISEGAEYGISCERDLLEFSQFEIDQFFTIASQEGVNTEGLPRDAHGVAQCARRLRAKMVEVYNGGESQLSSD